MKKNSIGTESPVLDLPSHSNRKQDETVTHPVMCTGTLVGIDPTGEPIVTIASDVTGAEWRARSCTPLEDAHVGSDVILLCGAAPAAKPIIIGIVRAGRPLSVPLSPGRNDSRGRFGVDEKVIELNAEDSIVLRCGEASITLHSNGKVTIRGAQVVSQAAGVNRIRGGSVELN